MNNIGKIIESITDTSIFKFEYFFKKNEDNQSVLDYKYLKKIEKNERFLILNNFKDAVEGLYDIPEKSIDYLNSKNNYIFWDFNLNKKICFGSSCVGNYFHICFDIL